MIDEIPAHIMEAARKCHKRIMAQSEGVGLTEARAVYNIAQAILSERSSARELALREATRLAEGSSGTFDHQSALAECRDCESGFHNGRVAAAAAIRTLFTLPVADHTADAGKMVPDDQRQAVSDYVPLCSMKGYHLILDVAVTEDEEPGCRVEFAGLIEDAEIDGFPFSFEGSCLRIEIGNAVYIMLERATLKTLTALNSAYSSIVARDLVSEELILGALAAYGIEPSSRISITFKNGEEQDKK